MHSRDLRPIRPAARRQHTTLGFTIIEAMVALLLFVVTTFGLAARSAPWTKSALRPEEDARASQLASTTMARLLDSAAADPALGPGAHDDDRNPHERIYYVSWNVDDNQPVASCKRITVTVRWPAANARRNVRLVAVTPTTKES